MHHSGPGADLQPPQCVRTVPAADEQGAADAGALREPRRRGPDPAVADLDHPHVALLAVGDAVAGSPAPAGVVDPDPAGRHEGGVQVGDGQLRVAGDARLEGERADLGIARRVDVERRVVPRPPPVQEPSLAVPAQAQRSARVADVEEVRIDPGDRGVAREDLRHRGGLADGPDAGVVDPEAGLVGVDPEQVGPDRSARVGPVPAREHDPGGHVARDDVAGGRRTPAEERDLGRDRARLVVAAVPGVVPLGEALLPRPGRRRLVGRGAPASAGAVTARAHATRAAVREVGARIPDRLGRSAPHDGEVDHRVRPG